MEEDVFSINKGIDNEFIFSIKKNDEILPLPLDDSDTFEMRIIRLSTRDVVSIINQVESDDGVIEFFDKPNGQILVKLKSSFTSELESEFGDRADRYYSKPMYEILVTGKSLVDGAIQFRIPEVYVS